MAGQDRAIDRLIERIHTGRTEQVDHGQIVARSCHRSQWLAGKSWSFKIIVLGREESPRTYERELAT